MSQEMKAVSDKMPEAFLMIIEFLFTAIITEIAAEPVSAGLADRWARHNFSLLTI